MLISEEKTVHLNEDVEVKHEADVVVIGGGVAGCAAAVAAGREQKSVILIESGGCLGGLATVGHVSPLDATHDRNGKTFGGIGQEILDRMDAAQQCYGVPDSTVKREAPHLLKWVLLQMVVESKVHILFHSVLLEPVMKENTIDSVLISTKSGIRAVRGKVFIDASGDGDMVARVGEEFIIGSEKNTFSLLHENGFDKMHFENSGSEIEEKNDGSCGVQPCSIMFTMGNVDASKNPAKFNNKLLKYEDLGIDKNEFMSLPYFGTPGFEENGDLIPLPQGRILISRTGRPGEYLINMSRIIGVNAADADELNNAEIAAQQQVMYLVDFLKRYVPGFENSFLTESGSTLGIR